MKRCFALIAAAAALSACGPMIVNIAYRPEGPAQPVLFERRPALFISTVTAAAGGKVQTYQEDMELAQPAAQTLKEALTTEFGRLQYPLAESAQQAEGVVEAAVARLEIAQTGTQGLSDLVQAEYSFDLTIKDAHQRTVLAKRITGVAKAVRPGIGIPTALYSGMLTSAIGQAMGKLGSVLESEDLVALLAGRRPNRKAAAAEAPAPIRVERRGKDKKGFMVTLIQQEEEAPPQTAAPPAASAPPAPPAAPQSDVDEVLPVRQAARPKSYAVVIGVGKYRHNLPAADFADQDARLVARYLRALGYLDANVATLINDEASKGDFEKHFERWLPNHVEAGSEVFVYYSGHGAPNVKTGDAYLVPYDADPTYIAETGYPLKKMYERLAKLPAAKVTVVMDSCFSGAGGRSVIAAGARPLVTVVQGDVPPNITVLSASAADQISNSYQEKGHGLFTYYFLKGLQEKGEDLRAVFDYLKPQVSGYARRELNADQDPQWKGGR